MTKPKRFAVLVEPSSYTTDLINNVYIPENIDYAFLNEKPLIALSDTDLGQEAITLDKMEFGKKISFFKKILDDYDMIIFNGYSQFEFLLLFFLNLLKKDRKVIAVESDTQYSKTGGIKGILKKVYLSKIFRSPFILGFAGGNYGHKDLFRHYGMNEKRIFLMPMMVNNEKFRNYKPEKKTPFVFLYVGRLVRHKNVEKLIKAFLQAFGNSERHFLRIVGDGECRAFLEKKYHNEENVLFIGARHSGKLIEAYHHSHVLVLPSFYEPWGLVVNEAMSAGLPVIASERVGAVGDLVIEGETGFVFNPDEISTLAKIMKTLSEDTNLYEKLSKNSKEKMENYWNYNLYRSQLDKATLKVNELLSSSKAFQ